MDMFDWSNLLMFKDIFLQGQDMGENQWPKTKVIFTQWSYMTLFREASDGPASYSHINEVLDIEALENVCRLGVR